MRRIEVLGIQGSGKSTILKILREEMLLSNMSAYNKDDLMALYYLNKYSMKSLMYLPFFSFIPKTISRLLFLFRSVHKRMQVDFIKKNQSLIIYLLSKLSINNEINIRDKVFDQVLMTYGNYELADKLLSSSDYLLLDEGLSYRPVSLFVSENFSMSNEQLNEYFSKIKSPSLVIYIKPEINSSLDRMMIRGFPQRIESKPVELQRAYLMNVKNSLDKIVNYYVGNGVRVHTISNNDGDLDSGELKEKIHKIVCEI